MSDLSLKCSTFCQLNEDKFDIVLRLHFSIICLDILQVTHGMLKLSVQILLGLKVKGQGHWVKNIVFHNFYVNSKNRPSIFIKLDTNYLLYYKDNAYCSVKSYDYYCVFGKTSKISVLGFFQKFSHYSLFSHVMQQQCLTLRNDGFTLTLD